MENAQTILVIILATAFALLLILHIVVLLICIKIARHIRHITEKAEAIAEKAESAAEFLQWTATPMAIGRFVASIGDLLLRRRGKSTSHKKED